ncbi:hypothetical protein TanjilG_15321 [Lupinus angustifolius]|uniref:Uncharacterized protein n=1 Tax=Lupinus angustifolius TaxID=3871 RepID=A0A1J7IB70_LUPAN|nr:PREDICTED: myosin-11-like [Lupinus angustifolius]OIW12081.1 hypothetical protein TanjilG_15321 [Lupinus angustifolius]
MGYNKGMYRGNGDNHRAKLYALMLMLAFGGALLGTMMLHQIREKKSGYNLVVKDKENEILSLQLLLQKGRNHNKEIERKNAELKTKIYALSGQKVELDRKVLKMKSTIKSLKDELKVIESELEENQNEIKMLQGQGNNFGKVGVEKVTTLKENHMQKEAKINELKQNLEMSIDDVTIFPENLAANRTMAEQDTNEEMDRDSSESTIYGDVTNDATGLIEFKDGNIIDDDQIQD